MLLEILWTLERLATEVTLVRLQGHVNSDVRGHVITLYGYCTAGLPLAREVEIVGAFAADMAIAQVILGGMLATDVATSDAFATRDECPRDVRNDSRAHV